MAGENPVGLECRGCGCRHMLQVSLTRQEPDRIRRVRECRHCGKRHVTYEKVVEEFTAKDAKGAKSGRIGGDGRNDDFDGSPRRHGGTENDEENGAESRGMETEGEEGGNSNTDRLAQDGAEGERDAQSGAEDGAPKRKKKAYRSVRKVNKGD